MKVALSFFMLLILTAVTPIPVHGQEKIKGNPIIFLEWGFGRAVGSGGGLTWSTALNFQTERNLFTVRYKGNTYFDEKPLFFIFPVPYSTMDEVAFLYGWRYINDGSAFSFSVGGSYNSFQVRQPDSTGQKVWKRSTFAGVPFEANIKWFKSSKKRFRIFFLVPVGKPTSFGGSIGLKLYGNVSRNSFLGLGLVYGLGFHKKYE